MKAKNIYSKSSSFYLDSKKDFFNENQKLLERAEDQNKLYSSQPNRLNCKICKSKLPGEIDFTSHGVNYCFCSNCEHLNGCFEDTTSFIDKIYIQEDGNDYASNYIDDNYQKRVSEIYIPKIDFLLNSINTSKISRLLDIGCGSGYFVSAAISRGLNAEGIDVNKAMVEYGNQQIRLLNGKSPLSYADERDFFKKIESSDADVISAIGVIEHLRLPHMFFDAFKKSSANYLMYSVPMFSLSVIIENVLENVFPRQLSGGHTHLFTEKSIQIMHEIIRVDPISYWRFGTDIMDLYRGFMVSLQRNQVSKKILENFENGFGVKIDELQSVLDRNHFCSEIHCVAQKKYKASLY